MSGTRTIPKRIVLRLDPDHPHDGALTAVARLAAAFHAELAARLVSDTRLVDALAFKAFAMPTRGLALDIETHVRRAEASLRRAIAELAEHERTAWSFEVIDCAGALARDCLMEQDDLVAIELSAATTVSLDLRAEVEAAVDRARGVLLVPQGAAAPRGPVVAMLAGATEARQLSTTAQDIAKVLGLPLRTFRHDERGSPHGEAADTATAIRRMRASLAIMSVGDPLVAQFLARPRFLREMATPLLLLKG